MKLVWLSLNLGALYVHIDHLTQVQLRSLPEPEIRTCHTFSFRPKTQYKTFIMLMHFQNKSINKEKWSEHVKLGISNVSWNFENVLDMKRNIDAASLMLFNILCLQLSTRLCFWQTSKY